MSLFIFFADALESPTPAAIAALESFVTWLDLANLVAASSFPFVAEKLAAVLLRDFLRALLLPALLSSSSTAAGYHNAPVSPSSASSAASSSSSSSSDASSTTAAAAAAPSPPPLPASVATAYVRRLIERWEAPALRTMLIQVYGTSWFDAAINHQLQNNN
jgi:hypothetical protein